MTNLLFQILLSFINALIMKCGLESGEFPGGDFPIKLTGVLVVPFRGYFEVC